MDNKTYSYNENIYSLKIGSDGFIPLSSKVAWNNVTFSFNVYLAEVKTIIKVNESLYAKHLNCINREKESVEQCKDIIKAFKDNDSAVLAKYEVNDTEKPEDYDKLLIVNQGNLDKLQTVFESDFEAWNEYNRWLVNQKKAVADFYSNPENLKPFYIKILNGDISKLDFDSQTCDKMLSEVFADFFLSLAKSL